MNQTFLITCTVITGFLVVYHHIGYPLILKLLNQKSPKHKVTTNSRHYTHSVNDSELPTITLIIAAYNEQRWIADKIRNLATLDYPSTHFNVLLACDGCTDDTCALALATMAEPECCDLNLQVINFPRNRGKVAVLNQVIDTVVADLVALSDVSALISIDALLIAAQRFEDPQIGVLNVHYRLLQPGSVGEQAYWQYQSRIKSGEAALGSTLGAHGAFYLFRRFLFEPLAPDTINDDFILPMKIVAAGYRADYEHSINALELEGSSQGQDSLRRRRIAAGNLQQLLRLKKLLLPRYRGTAFTFFSGKGLRVLMPLLMILTLLGCIALSPHDDLFFALAVMQSCGYLLAAWELVYKPKSSPKICKLLGYLVGGHCASLIGTLRYLLRLDKGHWQKFNG